MSKRNGKRELGINISEDDWLLIWQTQQTSTSSWMWRLHRWKNTIRYFITPKITGKHTLLIQPCWRKCGDINVHHSHIFWSCPKVSPFWKDIQIILIRLLGYNIPKTSIFLYLSNISKKYLKQTDISSKCSTPLSKKRSQDNGRRQCHQHSSDWKKYEGNICHGTDEL